MRWLICILVVLVGLGARADAVPKAVASKVSRDAQKYTDDLMILIEGFGRDGAIDRAALETIVAMARAEARAMALRRLQVADLDGDGAVAGTEVQATAAAASATVRGRMLVQFGHADGDGDGQVSAAELRAYAEAEALEAYSTDKALGLMAVMGFDGDGDGRVTRAEAQAGVAALARDLNRKPRELQNEFQVQGGGLGAPKPAQGRGRFAHLAAI